MWKALANLFERSSDAKKLVLKNKLRNIPMGKDDPIITYLSRLAQVRDELGGVRETVPSLGIVSLTLISLLKYWKIF